MLAIIGEESTQQQALTLARLKLFIHLKRAKEGCFLLFGELQSKSKGLQEERLTRANCGAEYFTTPWKILAARGQKKFGCACSECSALQCIVRRLIYPAKQDLGMNLQVLIWRNKRIELLKLCW